MKKMKFPSSSFEGDFATKPGRICLYPQMIPSLARQSQIQSEYGQLRETIPTVAKNYHVTKRQVVTEATRYIDELHSELVKKLRQKDEMNDFEVKLNQVNQMVLNIMCNTLINPQTRKKTSSQKNGKKCKQQQ